MTSLEPSPALSETKPATAAALKQCLRWFRRHRWKPFDFQREAWTDHLDGRSGMIHAPTGTGKTYAVAIPSLIE